MNATVSSDGQSSDSQTDEQDEKAAIPLELFFDLVFVFAITQVVSLIAHDLTATGVFRGAVVLALLWWGWGAWTWTANLIDLDPRVHRAVILTAMAPIFIMAHSVPFAFEDHGVWLAGGYAAVRVLSGVLLTVGTRHDAAMKRALVLFLPASAAGPIAVIIGAVLGGGQQQWWWLAGFCCELASAALAGRADWAIDAGHFAERHGLIVIIALGESIIVVGTRVVDQEPSGSLAVLLGVGLAGVCALWWAYFDRLALVWETALRSADEHEIGHVARDIYSFLHFPMIVGIVLYAVALEEAFSHPDDPMEPVVGWLLIGAIGLFLSATALATYRAYRGEVLYERVIGLSVIAAIVLGWSEAAAKSVALATTAVLLATMTAEYVRYRDRIRGLPAEAESAAVADS